MRRHDAVQAVFGTPVTRVPTRAAGRAGRLVLRRPEAVDALAEVVALRLDDLREAHDGDGVLVVDGTAVDLLEEVLHLLVAAELRVGGLEVPGRELAETLAPEPGEDRLEDPLARRVLVADRDEHALVLLVLVRLVAEADRRALPAPPELVGKDL